MPWLLRRDNFCAKVFCCCAAQKCNLPMQRRIAIIITRPFLQRCLWVFLSNWRITRKRDWQERCNYFEGLCIIHEKTLFRSSPESCIWLTDLSSPPGLHSSTTRTRKSGHAAACDCGFNENWCKCSSSHAYEPFISLPGGTKLWWQPWETRS